VSPSLVLPSDGGAEVVGPTAEVAREGAFEDDPDAGIVGV